MQLAISQGQLDLAHSFYAPTPINMSNRPYIWIMLLQNRDHWLTEYGAPLFKEAFAALRKEPRYQQALRKYGIDNDSLARVQVHTDGLWD